MMFRRRNSSLSHKKYVILKGINYGFEGFKSGETGTHIRITNKKVSHWVKKDECDVIIDGGAIQNDKENKDTDMQ